MPLYTLIAYRPDGVDTCRGCVMGTSSSDFSLQFFTERAPLIEAWAKIKADSEMSDREFSATEVTLLVDGRDDERWWADIGSQEQATESPFDGFYEPVLARTAVLVAAAQKAAADALEAKNEKQRQAQDERDRAAYAALHQRYGSAS